MIARIGAQVLKDGIGVVATEVDGKWYVSPFRTYSELFLTLMRGLEPKDIVGAIVDHSKLEGEDVHNVRVLERFSFAEVPTDRAQEVVTKLSGAVDYDVEVAKR